MKNYILPLIAVTTLFTLGFIVGDAPKEICNADRCILEGQVQDSSGYYYYIVSVNGVEKSRSELFGSKISQQYFAGQEGSNYKSGYEIQYYYTEHKAYL